MGKRRQEVKRYYGRNPVAQNMHTFYSHKCEPGDKRPAKRAKEADREARQASRQRDLT